ncbi:MAG: hypothetical protein HW403_14 [Dehalococcoidia bacterium]|nr:hypothetical protein [Dehalococcoidia bacterium]
MPPFFMLVIYPRSLGVKIVDGGKSRSALKRLFSVTQSSHGFNLIVITRK